MVLCRNVVASTMINFALINFHAFPMVVICDNWSTIDLWCFCLRAIINVLNNVRAPIGVLPNTLRSTMVFSLNEFPDLLGVTSELL